MCEQDIVGVGQTSNTTNRGWAALKPSQINFKNKLEYRCFNITLQVHLRTLFLKKNAYLKLLHKKGIPVLKWKHCQTSQKRVDTFQWITDKTEGSYQQIWGWEKRVNGRGVKECVYADSLQQLHGNQFTGCYEKTQWREQRHIATVNMAAGIIVFQYPHVIC